MHKALGSITRTIKTSNSKRPGMMVHAFNVSICEANLGAPGQPGLHIEFQANQSNTVRSCLKTKINQNISNSSIFSSMLLYKHHEK